MNAIDVTALFGPRGPELYDISFDEVENVRALLHRDEERSSTARDEWGNWDGQFARDPEQVFSPWIDERFRVKSRPVWPNEAPFALVLTHDIDTVNPYSFAEYSCRFFRSKGARRWRIPAGYLKNKILRKDARWDFSAWVDAEAKHGFRSSWFVFPNDAEPWERFDCSYRWRHPAQWTPTERIPFIDAVKRLGVAGHEVGLHGSYASATMPGLLAEQRFQLEQALGSSIVSLRQHYLHFDIEQTPALQEEAGFLVDSSVGMNRHVGFRSGTCLPHFLWNRLQNRPTKHLEIPLVLQDGPLFLFTPERDLKRLIVDTIDKVERVGGCLTVLFHPDCQRDAKKWKSYIFIMNEARKKRAWNATLRELRAYWLKDASDPAMTAE